MAIRLEHHDNAGHPTAELVLDAGDQGNWLTTADIELLLAHLHAIAERRPVLTVLHQHGADFTLGRRGRPEERREAHIYRLLDEVTRAWADLPCITVTQVMGRCEGFGVGLALQADITLACESASFRFPEVEHGFAPTVVLAWLTRLLPWPVVAPFILTGRTIDLDLLRSVGLVNDVLPATELPARADEVVEQLLSLSASALHECKAFAVATRDLDRAAASQAAVTSLVHHFEAV